MSNPTRTRATMSKLLAKMSRANFERACAKHNVAYTNHDKRADVIDVLLNVMFANVSQPDNSTALTIWQANPVEMPIETPVACAAELAHHDETPTPIVDANIVPNLLEKLRTTTSPLVKKRIRRQLRQNGYYISKQPV